MRWEEDVLDHARVPLFGRSLPRGLVLGQERRVWARPSPGPQNFRPLATLSWDRPQATGSQ